jgi:PAS domain S-box-containing protein
MHFIDQSDQNRLRSKAEEMVKSKSPNRNLAPTQTELLRLVHELEVHQIELELQNEELKLARDQSESLYRLLAENIDDVVSLHALDFKTIYASPSLEKVTGFRPEYFIGKDFFSLFNFKPDKHSDFTKYPRFIIPLKHGISGKEILLEMLWKPIYNDQGKLKSYLVASRDVTDREFVLEELKRTLEKEIELTQLKSKFISMTSHELRTPLATIQSSTDLIEIISEGVKEEKAHVGLVKQTRKIHAQLSRLTQIISDVVLFEKNNEGKLGYNQIDVDIKRLLVQLAFDQFGLKENESKIELELGHELIMVKSDPALLIHVLRNLIENAIKYTPEGSPKPILKMIRKEKTVDVQIVDFGIGIPQNDTKFLFNTFFRGSNVSNIKGTGLGLSIVNDLVRKLDGKMTFSSKENQGSTFIITLPLERKNLVV